MTQAPYHQMNPLDPASATVHDTSLFAVSSYDRAVDMQEQQGYTCSYCGKEFLIKHQFIGHMNMHMNLRPFTCKLCLKSFAYGTSLSRHKRLCHKVVGQNEYIP